MTVQDTTKVRIAKALKNDPRTKNARLEITGGQGLITISGYVDSREIQQAVLEIAENQEGVIKLMNETIVKGDPKTDEDKLNVLTFIQQN